MWTEMIRWETQEPNLSGVDVLDVRDAEEFHEEILGSVGADP